MRRRRGYITFSAILCVLIMVALGPVQAVCNVTLDTDTGVGVGSGSGSGIDHDTGAMGPGPRVLDLEDLLTELYLNGPAKGPSRDVVEEGVQGLSWRPLVPVNKVTLVGKDNTSYLDEYGFLASVPSSAFHVPESGLLYSNPLLIYEPDEGPYEPGYEPLDDYLSVHYFMEDWANYTEGIDSFEFVCMDGVNRTRVLDNWSDGNAQEVVHSCNDPASMAEDISFWNFEDAPVAVIAVIEPETNYDSTVQTGSKEGTLSAELVFDTKTFTGTVDVGIDTGIYHNFTVKEDHVYISSLMTWVGNGKDPDLQLYDWQLGQAGASEVWNPPSGAYEYISGYLYHAGPWGFGLTYMPTENTSRFQPMAVNPADYTIDATLYPGKEWRIPDRVPYGATDLQVTVTGDDPAEELGLIVRDEAGSRFARSFDDSHIQTVVIERPGQGHYNFTVMKLENYSTEATFNVTWSWSYDDSLDLGQALTSASHGAVVGSALGGPMFYAYPDQIRDGTIETMRRLGVKEVVVVDIGNRSLPSMLGSMTDHFEIADHITVLADSYAFVQGITGSSDIVFTSVNDWTYWLINTAAAGVEARTNHIGPATFAAAHHGTAPIIVELHEETAQAAAYFRHYWIGAYLSRRPAVVGDMVLEGSRVYDLMNDMGFDQNGSESMLTVADQFDIGLGFDRAFVGVADPGRIMGSPTDTAAWVSRSAFYPAIIFANPATDPAGLLMINGSNSTRDGGGGLHITPGGEELFVNPIVQSWVCYLHRFNERASTYWGLNYTSADGITPYWDQSPYDIDQDVNANRGRPGKYYADMSGSETVPFYAEKAGWDSVYSTQFDKTMENLNRGSLMWIEIMHGGHGGYGGVGFWGDGEPEDNPWRAYETQGSTEEPDSIRMNKVNGMDDTLSTGDHDRDGVIIAITQQSHTSGKSGMSFHNSLDNLHSTGFVAGSCLIAATFLHMTMVRHGSVYQIIDPWLTSWYVDLAIEAFVKYLAMNMSVGEAYSKAILHVGIGFLTDQWWWDIYENVVYFGDPDLRMYVPAFAWEEPVDQGYEDGLVIGGEHSPFGAPHIIKVEGLELLDGDDDGTGNSTLIFPRLKDYTFRVTVRDPDGLDDIAVSFLRSGIGSDTFGVDSHQFEETHDDRDHVEVNKAESQRTDDGLCVEVIEYKLKFNWTFDNESLTEMTVVAFDSGDGEQVVEVFPEVFKVENDLQFNGNLTAVPEFQGALAEGDWVRGGEGVTWSNITISYEGWPEVHPPAGECNVTVEAGNGTWASEPVPGEELLLTTHVPNMTLFEDIHEFSIGGVPEDCDKSNLSFLIRVDATPPTAPLNVTVHADGLEDEETSVDNDVELFITWEPSTDIGSGVLHLFFEDSDGACSGELEANATSYGPCNATGDHEYIFDVGAVDRVGNVGPSGNGSMMIDRLSVIWDPIGSNLTWRNNATVLANATVWDEGLSGLSGASVMYQLGHWNGTDQVWDDWVRLEGVEDAPPDTEVDLSVEVTFEEDGVHYMRWKATDLAGNGPVVSMEEELRIDTSPPSITVTGPETRVWYDGPTVNVTFEALDEHSGLSNIEYKIGPRMGGPWSEWTPVPVKGPEDPVNALEGTVTIEFPEGEYNQIYFKARDVAGNDWVGSNVHRVSINMGHNATISAPTNGTSVPRRYSVQLLAGPARNVDDDVLTYSWFSDVNGYLGNGSTILIIVKDQLDVGPHVLTLYVDDGHGHNVSANITITILRPKPKDDGQDLALFAWLALLALIIAIIAVVVFVMMRRKGRNGKAEDGEVVGRPMSPEGEGETQATTAGPETEPPPGVQEGEAPLGPGTEGSGSGPGPEPAPGPDEVTGEGPSTDTGEAGPVEGEEAPKEGPAEEEG